MYGGGKEEGPDPTGGDSVLLRLAPRLLTRSLACLLICLLIFVFAFMLALWLPFRSSPSPGTAHYRGPVASVVCRPPLLNTNVPIGVGAKAEEEDEEDEDRCWHCLFG
jgi:hypothetical protein